MRSNHYLKSVLLLLIICSLNACFLFRSYPYPKVAGGKVSENIKQDLIKKLADTALSPGREYVGLGNVLMDDGAQKSRFKLLVRLIPDRGVKIDFLPLQAAFPVLTFGQANGESHALDHVNRAHFYTQTSERLFEKLLGVPLDPEEFAYTLFGYLSPEIFEGFEGKIYEDDQYFEVVPDNKSNFARISKESLKFEYLEFRKKDSAQHVVRVRRDSIKGLPNLLIEVPAHDLKISVRMTAIKDKLPLPIDLSVPANYIEEQL